MGQVSSARWIRTLVASAGLLALVCAGNASAVMDLDTAASYFGKLSGVWGMRMSPDGTKSRSSATTPTISRSRW